MNVIIDRRGRPSWKDRRSDKSDTFSRSSSGGRRSTDQGEQDK